MKILIITKDFPPKVGGIPTYTFNIARHWPDSSANVLVLTANDRLAKDFDAKQQFKIIRSGFNRWLMLFEIWQIIKQKNVDLIHLHGVYHQSWLAGYFIKKIIKIDYRLFLHSIDFNYLKKNNWRKNKILKLSVLAKEIVVNSQYLKDQFNRQFENFTKPIKIVYPCPSEHFFVEIAAGAIDDLRAKLALEGKKVMLTVARLAEGKGFPRLIHILPKVLAKVPNLVWIIIGDGPKRQLFIDLIAKNNLQNIIRYLGVVPNEDLLKYYKLADLFVLLTHPDAEAEEDWATVFMESSACGRSILAGQVGGVEEGVKHMRTGLIVDVNNEQAVTNNLIELLKNKEYAKQMGGQGREWVKENFRWEREIKKIL